MTELAIIQSSHVGDVAQLGERGVRNAEVRGSIPLISTIFTDVFSSSGTLIPILNQR